MTANDETTPPDSSVAARLLTLSTPAILDVLDRLANGETLDAIRNATGLSDRAVLGYLRDAAAFIRTATDDASTRPAWPARSSLLDWRKMTVAEALEVLADHAIKSGRR